MSDFPVWNESDVNSPTDIRLEQVRVSQTHFETSPTTIVADIVSDGFRGQSLVAQLVDEQGKVIEEQTFTGTTDGQPCR